MSKTKAKISLSRGEAYVIQDADTWNYIANTFVTLGYEYPEGSDERDGWFFLADDIQAQARAHSTSIDDEDEW